MNQPRSSILLALAAMWLFYVLLTPPRLSAAPTTPTTMTLTEYSSMIAASAASLTEEPSSATVQLIQAELAMIKQVKLPDGTLVDVQPLLGTDTDSAPTVAEAQQRLTLVADQMMAAKGDDATARLARLAAIFEQPAFVQQDSLWARLWRWLRSWLPDQPAEEVSSQAGWLALAARWIGYLLITAGALLLVYLLSLWLQTLLGGFVGGVASGRQLTADGELLNATEARQQAHQLAKSGSFREAVRRLYLSALLTLDERDLLHYDRSNTNREVLATVRGRPALYQRLRPVVEIFDDVWYGVHEPDQATFDRYVQAVEQLNGAWPEANNDFSPQQPAKTRVQRVEEPEEVR